MKELLEAVAGYVSDTSGEAIHPDALAALANADGSIDKTKLDEVFGKARKGFLGKLTVNDEEVTKRTTEAFDKKEKALRATILDKRESELAQKFGVDGGLRGDALIDAINAKITTQTGKKSDLTKEEIEKSKPFLDALDGWKNSTAAEVEKVKKDFDAYKASVQQEKIQEEVRRRAVPIIEALKPRFDEDSQVIRDNQWKLIMDRLFEGRKFDAQEGRTVVLDAEGNMLKDAHKNAVEFAALIERIVKDNIGVRAADKRESAGAASQRDKPATSGEWKRELPKTKKEYNSLVTDLDIPLAEREALKAWRKANPEKLAA